MKRGVGVYYGVKGDARGVQVGSTGTLGVSGGPGGRQGDVKASQGVKKGVRSVPGVKGSLGDPRGLRVTSGVY